MTTTERPDLPDLPDFGSRRDRRRARTSSLALRYDPRHFGIDPDEPWPDDVPRGQDDSHWRYENDPRGARRAEIAHRLLLDR